MKKKVVSLQEHEDMMSMLKFLYGNDDAKDETEIHNPDGSAGTVGTGQMAESAPSTEGLIFPHKQRGEENGTTDPQPEAIRIAPWCIRPLHRIP